LCSKKINLPTTYFIRRVALNLWQGEANVSGFWMGMGYLIYLDVSSILFDE